ncbi:MAG: hypothetical protein HONBIEJF_00200 [Fimbriimonadaceae bacterium]|nr:hypothetical protein [Fimbriimonadaceae bacterium]
MAHMVACIVAIAVTAQPSPPNLICRGLDVHWVADKKIVLAYVSNPTPIATGPFMVFFTGEENPVSPMDRPQVRVNVPSLAPHTVKKIKANFTNLGTSQNAFLGNVTGMIVRVDAKNQVAETNETDNKLATPLPSILGAKSIFGAGLQCNGFVALDPNQNPLGQTFKPTQTMVMRGIEFSFHRETLSTTPTLLCRVYKGNALLRERTMNIAEFPPALGNPLPISSLQVGVAFVDLSNAPISLTAGTTYKFEFKCFGSDAIRAGLVNDSVQGNLIAPQPLVTADLAFKIFSDN